MSDFRVEAWRGIWQRGVDPGLAGMIDPAANEPFAIGSAQLGLGPQPIGAEAVDGSVPEGGTQLNGWVAIDRSPSVTLAWIALTGVGPDGRRYILEGPSFKSTSFAGTALDWFTAVLAGR